MRPDQEEVLRRMRTEWEVILPSLPDELEWFFTMRDLLVKLREIGFAVASCTWCALARPRGNEARCPVCECLVGRGGRRRFQRPSLFGVSVPDGGFDQAGRSEVEAKAKEFMLSQLAKALSTVASRGPKN